MSPSPTSRAGTGLAIGLCPDAVGIVRLGGWRQARVDGQESLVVAEPTADGLAAVAVLDLWLHQNRPAAAGLGRWFPAHVHVVLSDRLLRYACVPWSGGRLSLQEEAALNLGCFEERYSDMSGWTLRSAPGRYGQSRLAVAVPTVLLAALESSLRTHGLRGEAVTPYFIACWNRWRRDIAKAGGKADALVTVVDKGAAVIGVVSGKDGGWRSLRSLRTADGADDLARLLAREAVLQGLSDGATRWVHSPQHHAVTASGDDIHVLSAPPGGTAAVVMAMGGMAR